MAGKGRNRNTFKSTGAKHLVTSRDNPGTHSFSSSLCSFSWQKWHSWLAVLLFSLIQRHFPKVILWVKKTWKLGAMDLCGEADGVVRSRWRSKKLPGCSPSLLLWLLTLTCLKRCRCMFSFPLRDGTNKILYTEACFLIILILSESLFTRKFSWNTPICFKALVETRTQPENTITLALLPQDYQISFPVLHPAGSVSCHWCSHL